MEEVFRANLPAIGIQQPTAEYAFPVSGKLCAVPPGKRFRLPGIVHQGDFLPLTVKRWGSRIQKNSYLLLGITKGNNSRAFGGISRYFCLRDNTISAPFA
jgi:hypothetical protein